MPSSAAAPRACSAQGDSPGPGGDKETPEEVTGLPPGLPVSSFSELILFTLLPVLSLSCRPAWGWPAPTSPSVPGPPGPSSLPTAWNPGSGDPERTAKESSQAPAQNHLADGSPVSYPAPLPLVTPWTTRAGSVSYCSAPCTLSDRLVCFQGRTAVGTAGTFQPQVVLPSQFPLQGAPSCPLLPTYALRLLLPVHTIQVPSGLLPLLSPVSHSLYSQCV